MQHIFLASMLLLTTLVLGSRDPCNRELVKKHGSCPAYVKHLLKTRTLAIPQIFGLGLSPEYQCCRSFSPAELQQLMSYVGSLNTDKTLVEVLNFKCLTQLAVTSGSHLNIVLADIEADRSRLNNFIKSHADDFCEKPRRFTGTNLNRPIKEFCENSKIKNKDKDKAAEDNPKRREKMKSGFSPAYRTLGTAVVLLPGLLLVLAI